MTSEKKNVQKVIFFLRSHVKNVLYLGAYVVL